MKVSRPFFSYPQERLDELLNPIATAIRTLPDAQLDAEMSALSEACSKPGLHLSSGLLLTLYRAERGRRSDPEHRHDDDLDMILSRLERKTNDADRAAVITIGRELYRAGGTPCLLRARDRMVERASPQRRELRASMLAKRWRLDA